MEKEDDFLDEPSSPAKKSDSDEFEGRRLVDLSLLHNVPLNIIVELGRTDLNVKDLLTLHVGSTIELNKLAGEPLEFIISDRIAAKGEVVVLNEKFALRLTDIIDPLASEREQP
ncbi:flagellar motor switch protein FliN [Bacteriovoracales bacterium]|nr:flagellar motor switch protein FliN [Bacteriovoracales bacterium]